MWLEEPILRSYEAKNEGPTTFLLHSHLLVSINAVFPLQTPAPVMELVDVPDSKSGAARRGGSSPPRGTTPYFLFLSPLQLGAWTAFAMIIVNKKLLASIKNKLNEIKQ